MLVLTSHLGTVLCLLSKYQFAVRDISPRHVLQRVRLAGIEALQSNVVPEAKSFGCRVS